jgi:geranylgeranyl transferase type-2 subunit beta
MEIKSNQFHRDKHLEFINTLEQKKSLYSIGGYVRNHIQMGGAYWAVTSMLLLKQKIEESKIEELISWIKSCQNPDGGFGGNKGHDSNITNSLYALLVLFQFDKMDSVNLEKVGDYVQSMYVEETGSFMGDKFGEIDTRFVYSALYILVLLDRPLPKKSVEFLLQCINTDGGIGGQPCVESHAAYIFCGVSAFALLNKMSRIPVKKVKQFLGSRQTKLGGFNGRPEKLPDLCYSWWVLSSLHSVNSEIMRNSPLFSFYMKSAEENPNVGS